MKLITDPDRLNMAIHAVMSGYRKRATTHGLPFELTYDQFKTLIFSPCHYCGGLPEDSFKSKYMEKWYFLRNTIDRKDNNIGYTEQNSVPCCLVCNDRKVDWPATDWLSWIHRVADRTREWPGLDVTGSNKQLNERLMLWIRRMNAIKRLRNSR